MGEREVVMRLEMEKNFPMNKARVWEILSDTNRINRAIGLDPVNRGVVAADNVISRTLKSTALGLLPMEWQEYPFEWTAEEWYEVFRDYSRGPMSTFRSGIHLTDSSYDGQVQTTVQLYSNVVPANSLLLAPVKTIAKKSMKKTFLYIEKALAAGAMADAANPSSLYRSKDGHAVVANKINDAKLSECVAPLYKLGLDSKLIGNMEAFIRFSDDNDTADIKPYALATKWNYPRNDVLKLLLHATQSGLFNMQWRLICPNCRVSDNSSDKLASITDRYHCDWCGIDYEVMFDRFVEMCFSIHPQIRKVTRTMFCVGAPAFSPHIYSQRLIRSQETVSLKLPDKTIDWRLRVLRSNERLPLSIVAYPNDMIRNRDQGDQESREAKAQLIDLGWTTDELQGESGQTLQVTNSRDKDVVVVIEREGWDDIVATASQIMLFPEFRSMFSTDVLAPGQQAGISSLTVLFTDLCGSTAYYEAVGDSSAYGYVRQMFDFLQEVVEEHGGFVVKTIGDAVMAVFDSPEEGLKAALFIQNKWHAEKELSLRIGLHHGPAVAVGMNGRNDYFGRTVNMAARIQALGGPGEIVLEAELHQRLAGLEQESVQELTRVQSSEPFVAELKGLSEPVKLIRLQVEQLMLA